MDSIFIWFQKLKPHRKAPTLRRELKARRLAMIAIGSSIGTGLFVASGATISRHNRLGGTFSLIS
jgi:lysine-specific permease